MWRYLKNVQKPPPPGLPDPRKEKTVEEAKVTVAANEEVGACSQVKKRAKDGYIKYSDEQRADIAKYATQHGNSRAAAHFSRVLKKRLNESTVRGFVKQYQRCKKNQPTENVTKLSLKQQGRPQMLGQHDKLVEKYVRNLRKAGGIVNRKIVVAAAIGVLKAKGKRHLLKEHGGSLEFTRGWAQSFLKRLGFVKRKGTKAARKIPSDFPDLKKAFLDRITTAVKEDNIPKEMIINFDQTGAPIVPVSNWTLEQEGAKQVAIVGGEDKRQITALLAATAHGKLLPPQLLYKGTTPRCHPQFKFPEDWDIHHTANHWSNSDSMERYVEKVLMPYMDKTKEELNLEENQKGLIILDVFAAHRTAAVIGALTENNMRIVYVPGGCTGELQPLDVSVNGKFKAKLSDCFTQWYADEVAKAMADVDGDELPEGFANDKIDLRLSYLKPLHANWMLASIDHIQDKDEILRGFEKSGIMDAIEQASDGSAEAVDEESMDAIEQASDGSAEAVDEERNIFQNILRNFPEN